MDNDDYDYCDECRIYGDDYYYDAETGEDVSACEECIYNRREDDE